MGYPNWPRFTRYPHLNLLGTFTWNLLLETLEPPTTFAWNPYIFGTWEPFLGTVACLEPSLKIFGLEPWNLGTSCILKLELLEVSPGTCLEPFNHDKPKPSYMEQCWNLKTPATFQNLLGTAEPLGTSTWNLEPFDTFWNLHLEPVLETRNLYWMLAWNFRAFRNLALLETPFLNLYLELSLGTSQLGTSWNFEAFQNLSLKALVAWNLHLKPDLEPLLGPLSWNLATFQNQTVLGTLEPSKPVLGTRVFVDLLDPSLATSNLETLPGTLTENLRNSWGLYLESLLGALEPSETLLKNLCWEPRPSLGTFQNLYSYLDGTYMLYLEPRNLPEPLLGTLARNLGTFWNPLWLEPLLGTSEPAGTFTWNPYTWNLGTFGTLLGTLTWNLGTCRNLYLEPLYLEPRNLRNLTWNPYLEPRNLPEPLLGTLILGTSEPSEPYLEPLITWNLGTCRNLYLEPLLGTSEPAGTFTWNPYSEPRNLPEPLLGTLTWNLGTCQNLAGWLPQSAPGLSLARTPKLSAVGE